MSRYQNNPGPGHCMAMKMIIRYLKGTIDIASCYQAGSLQLIGYSDADGATDKDEHNSTFGYAFLLGGSDITWCSKNKPCIAFGYAFLLGGTLLLGVTRISLVSLCAL